MADEKQENAGEIPVRRELLITYHGDPANKPMLSVNGAVGGLAPSGDLVVANLYLEQFTIPVAGRIPIRDDGTAHPGDEQFDTRSQIQRTIVGSITMPIGAAEIIANWLLSKVEEARNRNQGEQS